MAEWTSSDLALEINTYVVAKRRLNQDKRWEYVPMKKGAGGWARLVMFLFREYKQFHDQVAHFSSDKQRETKLKTIARVLEKKNQTYEFKLPDGTDDWYVAFSKPARYRVDASGDFR
jgi:hypothetical protein